MIQDIAPHTMHNQFQVGMTPDAGSPVFLFTGNRLDSIMAFEENGRIAFPVYCQMPEGIQYTYLFSIDEDKYFMGTPDEQAEAALPDGLTPLKIRDLRPKYYLGDENRHLIFAAYTGGQLAGWYRDNRFFGRCGSLMQPGVKERNMCCPACKNTVYPKIMPAVIVGVTKGDQILMTRYKGREYGGHALIAGFCEIGETGEDTVRREVMEEAGIHVKNIRYYKSQPWGFESDLLLGYFCEADGDEEIRMDDDELSEAVWIKRDEIEEHFENMSLTNEMICHFKGEI